MGHAESEAVGRLHLQLDASARKRRGRWGTGESRRSVHLEIDGRTVVHAQPRGGRQAKEDAHVEAPGVAIDLRPVLAFPEAEVDSSKCLDLARHVVDAESEAQ